MSKQYIAGIFDGEGSIGIWSQGKARSNCNYSLCIHIVMCHEVVIKKIHQLYPEGHITYDSGKNSWRFSLKGFNSKRFLEDIFPYLIVKSDQVSIALSFLEELERRYSEKSKFSNLSYEDKQITMKFVKTMKDLKYENSKYINV